MKGINKILLVLVFSLMGITAQAQEIKVWKLADLKRAIAQSNKPTVLNFWATFCQPCLKEIPYFQEVVKKYEKQGVQLIPCPSRVSQRGLGARIH